MKPAEMYRHLERLLQITAKLYDGYQQKMIGATDGVLLKAYQALGAEPTAGKKLQDYRLGPGMSKERKTIFLSFFQEAETRIQKLIPQLVNTWTQYLRAADTLNELVSREEALDIPGDVKKQIADALDRAASIKQAMQTPRDRAARAFLNTDYFTHKVDVFSGIERVLDTKDYVKALFGVTK